MLADPQSVTYNAVAKSLAAISRGDDQSTYFLNDSGVKYTLNVLHTFKKGGRNRVVARLNRESYATDPLVPADNIIAGMTATVTFDFPDFGLVNTDVQNLGNALTAWLSSANILKLVNGET